MKTNGLRLSVIEMFPVAAALLVIALVVGATNDTACVMRDAQGKVRPHKVLLFIDSTYFSLFHNWVAHYNSSCRGHLQALELACMDARVSRNLHSLKMGLRCSKAFNATVSEKSSTDMSRVWMKRVQILSNVLSSGRDVLLSDTDAIWKRDPFLHLSQHAGAHIVASRGWFPHDLANQWGSTLCMGFIYFRSNPLTQTFVRLLAQHMESSGDEADDQLSLNLLLEQLQVHWPESMHSTYRTQAHTTHLSLLSPPSPSPPSSPLSSFNSADLLEVTLLPEQFFLRNCYAQRRKQFGRWVKPTVEVLRVVQATTDPAVVVHCNLAPGRPDLKQHFLVAFSLWKLPFIRAASLAFIDKFDKERMRTERDREKERQRIERRERKQRERGMGRGRERDMALGPRRRAG